MFKLSSKTFVLLGTCLWFTSGLSQRALAQVPIGPPGQTGDVALQQTQASATPPRVTLGVPSQPPRVSLGLPQSLGPAAAPASSLARGPLFDDLALPPATGNSSPSRQRSLFQSSSQVNPLDALPPSLLKDLAPPPAAGVPAPKALEAVVPVPAPATAPAMSQPSTVPSNTPVPSAAPSFDPLDALPPAMLESVPLPPAADAPATRPQSSNPQSNIPQGSNSRDNATPTPPPASLQEPSPLAAGPNRFSDTAENEKAKQSKGPYFFGVAGEEHVPAVDQQAWQTPYSPAAFSPQPQPDPLAATPIDPVLEASPYRGKFAVPTQRPWVELWRPLYTSGIYPPAQEWLGRRNLIMPHFMVYGDYRTGVGINRNANGDINNWAQRLNLDMDLEITATERLHAFMGPLDRNGDYTRLDFTDRVDLVDRTDIRFDNLFFEGDAGAIWGGLTDQGAPFDLPFSFGYLPVFYQNGIWANDNVIGAAVAVPAKNSPLLKWSNYDATFFWASDQVNSDAFAGDNNAAEFFGTAWFIEAYDGYIEADYAFVHDDVGQHRSHHNLSVAYTRRYFMRVSNSIRYITNFGQSLPSDQRTADGHMLLLENSWISKSPNTVVPYLNFFYGQGRTQSLARANNAGGILNNTGINFETDGLTGYPTLDATGANASGAALGINLLGADFQHQLILEAAALAANGQAALRNAPGDQFALGMRYQKPLNNAWIFRTDHMLGFREHAQDLRGSRVELRWKF